MNVGETIVTPHRGTTPAPLRAERLETPTWSVIVIARNETARIRRCVLSLMRAMEGHSHEILVADSASTDDTARIVEELGVRVVRIPPHFPLSPAAGRHVGYLHARGSLLLFMDGDSDLDAAWVAAAETALTDARVGGVAGFRRLVDAESGVELRSDQYSAGTATAPIESEYLGGPAAYRRDVLREVGAFNPFLRAYEEAEIGGRVRHAGYTLLRLPLRMTSHYVTGGHETFADLRRRTRNGYLLGRGQLLRYGVRDGCVRGQHVEGLSRLLAFAAFEVALVAAAVVALAGGGSTYLAAAIAVLALAYVAFALRARSFRKPAYYFCEWAIAAPIFLVGFCRSPRRADEYPRVPEPA